MKENIDIIEHQFLKAGAEFLLTPMALQEKLKTIKAFVFDWDGVFNGGDKNDNRSSSFNEADSMGTNLLRYTHYRLYGEIPVTAIISGEKNSMSFYYSSRERFHSCYFKIGNKIEALNHLCKEHNIKPSEVCYFFDDVLDLSIAKVCGMRIMINRNAGILFKHYVRENKLADYLTANQGGNFALREACEMLMGISGAFDQTIKERTEYGAVYKEYIERRNQTTTTYYTLSEGKILESPDN
ncbi:MAG TPA: phosphatase [Bacteroidia bacterium]